MTRIIPRKMDFPFTAEIPRHWIRGSVVGSAIGNGLNMLFPLGERFFVRSVRHYMDVISQDPVLLEQVRAFFAQEGHHAREHERFFAIMKEHGYDVDRFLEPYNRVAYGFLEKLTGPKLHLAVTVALEHYTATFAQGALTDDLFESGIPKVMADLLRWHAAEEIEHKAVAFDVLQRVDPSYALRMAGLILATLSLLGFWIHAAVVLLRQEEGATPLRMIRELYDAVASGKVANGDMRRAFFQYIRPDFHPDDIDNRGLAGAFLQSLGRAEA